MAKFRIVTSGLVVLGLLAALSPVYAVGGLTASLEYSPESVTAGAKATEVSRIKISAGSENVTISSLWVSGGGYQNNITRAYVEYDSSLIPSYEAGGGYLHYFKFADGLKILANSVKTISIKADISPTAPAGSLVRLGISSVNGTMGSVVESSLGISASGGDVLIRAPADADEPLRVGVTTDKLVYSPDETITISIAGINDSNTDKVLNFSSGCQTAYVIVDAYDSSEQTLCTKNLTSVTLLANSKTVWTVYHTPDAFKLKEGTYKLNGQIIGYGSESVEITVSSKIPETNPEPPTEQPSTEPEKIVIEERRQTETAKDRVSDGDLVLDQGTVYVIDQGKKRGIVSREVFQKLGYNFKHLIKSDLSSLPAGEVIDREVRHPRGSLVINKGTVYFMGAAHRYPFPSREIFLSWGNKFDRIVPANPTDLEVPEGPHAEMKQ